MALKVLFSYIVGYVNIIVEGFFVERFINICRNKEINLWDIKRDKATLLYAKVGIKDFKRLREIAKKSKVKIKIQKKKGIPFVINKYKKRKPFIIFLLLILIGIIAMSNFVWNIEISGNEEIADEEILQVLEEEGLKLGTLKSKISTVSIINKIRLKRDDIAWIGITIKGTNAIVELKETNKAPEIIDEDEYCNIIANKECMITKISVQNGTAVAKVGDIVKKGDVLVVGYLEGKYTGIRYVHSMANIEARVWYSKKVKVPLNQEVKSTTGNEETKYSLQIKKFKINFYKTLSKFKNYDTINESKKIMLFSNFYLPIEIIKTTNKEYDVKDVTYTEEELTNKTTLEIEKELEQEIEEKDNIINKQINTNKIEGYIEVEVIYEVLETIGVEDKIIF